MKNVLLSLLFVLSAIADSHAQYNTNRNKVWVFGRKAGLDFTSGVPVPVTTALVPGGIISEGCASVSDTSGHLLFYTDGKMVYNRDHNLMPSGSSIVPFETFSTTQAAVIVPVIGSLTRYYLFSLEQISTSAGGNCHLAYSIVDMSLEGGYGDVVTSAANIPLADSLSEKMVPVLGSNHNIWLLTHSRDTSLFLAYEITSAGIDTVPVVSAVGTFSGEFGYSGGVLKASHDGRKLVAQCMYGYAAISKGTELYDFDPVTGIVSNCVVLELANLQYGAEFSPDNTKLYTEQAILTLTGNTVKIYQYDVSSGSSSAILSSRTLVVNEVTKEGSDLKLGPDDKIYFAGRDDSSISHSLYTSRYLDCISNPNATGAACGYTAHAVKLADTTGIFFGLPNVVMYVPPAPTPTDNYETPALVSGLSVFPNPATAELTIISPAKITGITIYDLPGHDIWHGAYNSEMVKVDVSILPPNIYFVQVNGSTVKKFIKL